VFGEVAAVMLYGGQGVSAEKYILKWASREPSGGKNYECVTCISVYLSALIE